MSQLNHHLIKQVLEKYESKSKSDYEEMKEKKTVLMFGPCDNVSRDIRNAKIIMANAFSEQDYDKTSIIEIAKMLQAERLNNTKKN
jgi:hypothetical protein